MDFVDGQLAMPKAHDKIAFAGYVDGAIVAGVIDATTAAPIWYREFTGTPLNRALALTYSQPNNTKLFLLARDANLLYGGLWFINPADGSLLSAHYIYQGSGFYSWLLYGVGVTDTGVAYLPTLKSGGAW